MINSALNGGFPAVIQNGAATPQATASFNPVVIPFGAAATWVRDVIALRR
jgi:hypothetical protein